MVELELMTCSSLECPPRQSMCGLDISGKSCIMQGDLKWLQYSMAEAACTDNGESGLESHDTGLEPVLHKIA